MIQYWDHSLATRRGQFVCTHRLSYTVSWLSGLRYNQVMTIAVDVRYQINARVDFAAVKVRPITLSDYQKFE